MLPSLSQVRAEKARRSLHEFIVQGWHTVEPATPFIDGWHLRAIAEHLEAVSRGQIRNLLVNMPPRHMKSLAISVFWPCWEWVDSPAIRWLFSSYKLDLATRDSVACRRVIRSPWYQGNWGHVFRLVDDQDEKLRFQNSASGTRIVVPVDAGTGEGGNRIVIDDPHSTTQAESDTKRTATIDWFDKAMASRLNDPKKDCRVIVMQRLHSEDLSGHVLEQGGWEHLCLPCEYDPRRSRVTSLGWKDPRTEPDELLWPERFGREEVDSLKRQLGSYASAGQLQQLPSPAEGGLVKRTWWQYYDSVPDGLTQHLLSLDAAFKGSTDSDFVVIQCWAKKNADFYLLDQDRGRWNFPDTQRHFLEMVKKWPQATTKIVECKANGQAIIDSLRDKVSGMIAENPHESKEARVSAVSPLIEAGNVWLPRAASFTEGFVEEFAQFPAGAHDDQVDCASQSLKRLRIKPFERHSVLPR